MDPSSRLSRIYYVLDDIKSLYQVYIEVPPICGRISTEAKRSKNLLINLTFAKLTARSLFLKLVGQGLTHRSSSNHDIFDTF